MLNPDTLYVLAQIDEAQTKNLDLSSVEGQGLVASVISAVKTGADISRRDAAWLKAVQNLKDRGPLVNLVPDPGGVTAIWTRLQSWRALLLEVHADCDSEIHCITSISTGIGKIPDPGPFVPVTHGECDPRWTLVWLHSHKAVIAEDNGDEDLVRMHIEAMHVIVRDGSLYTVTSDHRLNRPTDIFGSIGPRLGQILNKYDIDARRDGHVDGRKNKR